MITIKSDKPTFIDIDDTLVMWKGTEYTPNQKNINSLIRHKKRGHAIVVWSAGGYEWAHRVVLELGLEEYVDLVVCKPAWYIDDKPASDFMPESIRYWYAQS